jgi:hypothetical protein
MPSQLIHLEVCADAVARTAPWGTGEPAAPWGTGEPPAGDLLGPSLGPLLGSFLLGAIAPDAWAVAGLARAATHFWSLEDDTSGLIRFGRAHPDLTGPRRPAGPRDARWAFLAGYLCHLVTDEQWTFTVYRPYFGRRSPFGASAEGQRTQLALQATMEQDLRDRRGADLARWLAALSAAPLDAGLPFLGDDAIGRWRDLQLEGSRLPTSPAAFSHVLERTSRPNDPDAAERLASDWPTLAARAATVVPPTALTTFRTRAGAACAALLAARG